MASIPSRQVVQQEGKKSIVSSSDDTNIDLDHLDPKKFLLEIRRRGLTCEGLPTEVDEKITMEYLIQTTRALIVTNQEIWKRCKRYLGKGKDDRLAHNSFYTFFRVEYSTVKARTRKSTNLVFEAPLGLTKRAFHIPHAIPSPLTLLAVDPGPLTDDIMPNFEVFLERSMLLVDDILLVFLFKFKDFLEKLQLALGDIDAWFLEGKECKVFLESHFGKQADISDSDLKKIHDLPNPNHYDRYPYGPNCAICGEAFSQHQLNTQRSWRNCSGGDNRPACIPIPDGTTQQLLCCSLQGTVDLNFFLDLPGDRNRLIKFLDFARQNGNDRP